MTSHVTHLECAKSGKHYSHREPAGLSEDGVPLLVRYDLDAVKAAVRPEQFRGRVASMWRYRELLPADHPESAITLGEGKVPLLRAPRLGAAIGLPRLTVMDEGQNPTGSFKDRGASMGVTRANELGIRAIAMATAGNAGGAWAAYGSRAGIAVHLAMPEETPAPNKLEARAYGASVHEVDGVINDAGKYIAARVAEEGWFDACTLKEPYRIEGKKTLGLEIAEHYDWGAPDAILYPTGGGVGIIGIWKVYQEMITLGWIRDGKLPRLISVQTAGCAPIVKAFEEDRPECAFWEDSWTVASGLRVPKALGDFLVLRAVRETDGTAVAVTDEALLGAMSDLATLEGISASPEGAATAAAARKLAESGYLMPTDEVLIINTANAVKYPEAMAKMSDAGRGRKS
jgi:threonine synthase